MAIRNIRVDGDEVLRKVCKPVKEVTPRILELIEDMYETMYSSDGVGLAAPQVGILKNLAVIDVGEGPITLINPEITEFSGEQEGVEGCLSIPGKVGIVIRPYKVKVEALNEKMEPIEFIAEEFFARAVCHELDHLNGVLYKDKVENGLMDAEEFAKEMEEKEEDE